MHAIKIIKVENISYDFSRQSSANGEFSVDKYCFLPKIKNGFDV